MANAKDMDSIETQEWIDALKSVIEHEGKERAHFLLEQLLYEARGNGITYPYSANTPYKNTISEHDEPPYPGNEEVEKRISALIRWNAVAMVLRAGKKAPELGGHLASFASSATLYDVGFNHFFNAKSDIHDGDLVFVQGHCAPGIYARSFLEGRLSEEQLANFRQEVEVDGLSSYPHPWLMPDYWQFPTVSMGLGPLQAIYQARFLKYLHNRGLADTANRKVWMFCGDGEMDEVESLGAINRAVQEGLDNLIFVINCNLQRLDGPVRGNGKIVNEMEGIFRGAGWNVIKVLWGSRWDALFAKDKSGKLLQRMEEALDGDYQNYKANDGAYVREHFFNKYPETAALVANMSDEDIWSLNRGGHDPHKVYAAYKTATEHKGQPTVILAKTVKGYGMGAAGEGQNTTHQQKKMAEKDLITFRNRFSIPIPEHEVPKAPFYRPNENSEEIQYLKAKRDALGGALPARHHQTTPLKVPGLDAFDSITQGSGDREISTTMAFVRCLNVLMKDKNIGERVVPIVPDECRTFGMEGMFRQYGIYSPKGQLYQPVDAGQIMYYREDVKGQLLEEGINEAGAMASWMAAATSYSVSGLPMIPFYIYYSMFGFQRVGDLAWAAGDMQARGFLVGGTAGRTTLAGEGLQHQDGHSHLHFASIPNCVTYDPTFAYELAVIMQDGLRRMYQENENIFYYLTVMNENYLQPEMPKGVEQGIIKGMYKLAQHPGKNTVQLLGSGTILREVITAAEILAKDYNVGSDVWSVTSFNELRREALDIDRWNLRNPDKKAKRSYINECLANSKGPIISATDYLRLYSDQIRGFIPEKAFYALGTDGYGRSDTRKQLRHFFEVDAKSIVYTALKALADAGEIEMTVVSKAMKDLGIDSNKPNPMTV